jgi:hypothetical protein
MVMGNCKLGISRDSGSKMTDCLITLTENLVKKANAIFGSRGIGRLLRCLRKNVESGGRVALSGQLLSLSRKLESLICREGSNSTGRK